MSAPVVEAAVRVTLLSLIVWSAMKILRPKNVYLEKTIWITAVLGSLAIPPLIALDAVPAIHSSYVLVVPAAPSRFIGALENYADAASSLYLMIAGVFVLRFAVAWIRMWRVRRKAEVLRWSADASHDIRISPCVSSPATFGRTILLPTASIDWPASTWRAVLSHERAHVRSRDCHLQWLVHLHACIFWINPLAWWMQRRLCLLTENLSDDEAAAELGSRPAYAEVLLQLASAHSRPPVSLAMAQCNVSARIERMISEIPVMNSPTLLHRLLCVAPLVPIVTMAALPLHECSFVFIGL